MIKKHKKWNVWIISYIFILCWFVPVQGEVIIPDQIHIGLKQYFNNAKKIVIKNTSLVLGYEVGNQWMVETIFESSAGYEVQPAPGQYYFISQATFSTYKDALNQSQLLSKVGLEGILVYPMYVEPGYWRIDVGGFANLQQMQEIQSKLSVSDLSFIQDTEKNRRILFRGGEGISFFVSGEKLVPTFGTGDERNGVAIWDLEGRLYRGKMTFHRLDEEGVTPVNVLPFEEYLYGVVPAEIIPSWPMESLKAQAVAARNYALYQLYYTRKYEQEPYDLCDTTISQVYKGYSVENPRTTQAVNETQGKLLYHQNELVATYYFSSSGGHTEDSENVWSGAVAYLRGVPDLYETAPEVGSWRQVLTNKEIEQLLKKNGVDIGEVMDVNVVGYTSSGRALELGITGTKGDHFLKKETMRYWLDLKSRKFQLVKSQGLSSTFVYTTGNWGSDKKSKALENLFVVGENQMTRTIINQDQSIVVKGEKNMKIYSLMSAPKDGFVFEGQGWGHGVGMSQSGARGMAEKGYTYDQILTYYYSGTTLR